MRNALLCCWLFVASQVWGHIGSPNVYFEGKVGPFPLRVVIRPPGVVPGLAEINVRVLEGSVQRVTALPVYWDAGREGAPPPDVAEPVRGETNLYSTSLWLMKPGAYSVDVMVAGQEGGGTIIVPVDSVAATRNTMPPWFSAMLAALGAILLLGAAKLVGAAFGEAILDPGSALVGNLRWHSRLATVGGAIAVSLLLLFGKAWWDREDRDYRNNRLYKPTPIAADVRVEQSQPIMRLTIDESQARDWTPLIPDHGKLMHLFLIREPALDAFAHLHPSQQRPKTFEVALPPLPEGEYRVYADVTHENGSSETLTTLVNVPAFPESLRRLWQPQGKSEVICSSSWWFNLRTNLILTPDLDDSWHMESTSKDEPDKSSLAGQQFRRLAEGYTMVWEKEGRLVANREVSLRFKLLSYDRVAPLEPYMGMFGHAAVRRKDGAVFAHVHPVGTFSMASQRFFVQRESSNEIIEQSRSQDPASLPVAFDSHTNHIASTNTVSAVSFPYEFPKPGSYRIWVQLKSRSRVFTGVFDTEIDSDK